MGYLLFKEIMKISLKSFFNITSMILILFAAGLVAHGIHELQEAHVIPIVIEHIFDLNPQVNIDGTYPLLHEKGYIGAIFKEVLGYNGNPNLLEFLSYLVYLLASILMWYLGSNKVRASSAVA